MKPFPEDEGAVPAAETVTGGSGGFFIAGLVAYACGFLLLARDHPDAAPFVIVGGILLMMWAFLL